MSPSTRHATVLGLTFLLTAPPAAGEPELPPLQVGACAEERFRIALVRSCFRPQPDGSPLARVCGEDQEARTSRNFAIPPHALRVAWYVADVADPAAVRFDVREDHVRERDLTIHPGLQHGQVVDAHAGGGLYVATPRGAEPVRPDQPTFTVCAYEN